MKFTKIIATIFLSVTLALPAVASPNWVEDFLRRLHPKSVTPRPEVVPASTIGQFLRTGEVPVSLSDVINMMVDNNLDIRANRYAPRSQYFQTLVFYRALQPSLRFSANVAKDTLLSTTQLNGASAREQLMGNYAVGFAKPLATGTSFSVDATMFRLSSNSNNSIFNPSWQGRVTYTVGQHLLQNRGRLVNTRQILQGQNSEKISEIQFEIQLTGLIAQAQKAYWDLVFALRNLQIQRKSVLDARTQLEHNQRLVAEGQLAPIDIVAAETQLANFEQAEFTALEDVTRAENNLKNLVAEDQHSPLWNVSVVPTDDVDLTPPQVSLSDAMKAATENRQELKQSDLAREINLLDQKLYRDQTKPQIDLVGTYGVVGNAGTLTSAVSPFSLTTNQLVTRVNQLSALAGLPVLPPTPTTSIPSNLIGGYGQSISNLASNQFNNFRVGVSISLPLRNRTAEGQLGHALVEGRRIATQREQLEQLIQVEVRNALQSLTTAEARLRSAAVARADAEQQYESEKRKLDAGQSTVFLVLERQTALATARGNELRAQTDLNKAIADLQHATGNSLAANNVAVSSH